MTLSNKWQAPHPPVARPGGVQEETSSIPGIVAVRGEEERNEEDDRTEVEREDGSIFTTQNSLFLNQNRAATIEDEPQEGRVDESNLDDATLSGNEEVPENLNIVSSSPVHLGDESLDSESTSSSTRRRNEALERENAELRRLLQSHDVPESLESNESPTSSLGSTSTSSSTRRRNEELQQQLDKALRQLEISNQRDEWMELNQVQQIAVEEHLKCESQNPEGLPVAYAFEVVEVGSSTEGSQARQVNPGSGTVVKAKKAWWKKWWVIGGVVILVVVIGGVLYYLGAFSAGVSAAGAATGETSAVGTAGVAACETATAETATAGAAAVIGNLAFMLSSRKKR